MKHLILSLVITFSSSVHALREEYPPPTRCSDDALRSRQECMDTHAKIVKQMREEIRRLEARMAINQDKILLMQKTLTTVNSETGFWQIALESDLAELTFLESAPRLTKKILQEIPSLEAWCQGEVSDESFASFLLGIPLPEIFWQIEDLKSHYNSTQDHFAYAERKFFEGKEKLAHLENEISEREKENSRLKGEKERANLRANESENAHRECFRPKSC